MNTRDLFVLVADKDMQLGVRSLLQRTENLRIRPISTEVRVHPEHDPGCYLRAHTFLRSFLTEFDKALVVLDCEGCGAEHLGRPTLEAAVEARLASCGWENRSAAIVIDPELEAWVWSDSPNVGPALGWRARDQLMTWLQNRNMVIDGQVKPSRPKECVEAALRQVRKPKSSQIFADLASSVSLDRCVDASFQKFKQILHEWFPAYPAQNG